MPDQPPRKSKTPGQEAFETVAFLWAGVAVAAFFGWQYNIPIVHALVQQVNRALSPYTLALLQKTLGHVNPTPGLLFNLAVIATILFVLSKTLIPILERLSIRDLIRRGDREARKIKAAPAEGYRKMRKKSQDRQRPYP